MSRDVVLRRLDAAVEAVAQAGRRGLCTRTGEEATAELAAVHAALVGARDRVRGGGDVDVERLGGLVREVAAWTPDTELALLAALGAVIQAARGRS